MPAETEILSKRPVLAEVDAWNHVRRVKDAAARALAPRHTLTELRINLLTGRTHQIRAVMGCEGLPLVGDLMYGWPNPFSFSHTDLRFLPLRAAHLKFRGPGNRWHEFALRYE